MSGLADASTVVSSAFLRGLAKDAGFDLCGFARATPIPKENLVPWIEAGFAADMDWMTESVEERLDVRRVLPAAKTMIALVCNYYRTDEASEHSPIARYARGRDYHATLKDRLRRFRKAIREHFGHLETYGSVDTGPFMEKVWAARAGLGYVAKNGCFVTEAFGSYVNLSVLAIELVVDVYADGPVDDRCGTCSLCITACPTDAIVEEARVDARRCLAYQTIENEGAIPERLRLGMENLVFGCDICQEVCPLNHRPVETSDRFAPRAVASLGVLELASMTEETYRQLVPGTALGRAKYDGLRRNALYALGAAKDVRGVDVAKRLREDPSSTVQDAARWALERLQSPSKP